MATGARTFFGNLTASGSDSYTYSSENLLTSGKVGSVTTPLTYDPLDRLYQIGTSGGMKLVYDGAAIIGQSNGTTASRTARPAMRNRPARRLNQIKSLLYPIT